MQKTLSAIKKELSEKATGNKEHSWLSRYQKKYEPAQSMGQLLEMLKDDIEFTFNKLFNASWIEENFDQETLTANGFIVNSNVTDSDQLRGTHIIVAGKSDVSFNAERGKDMFIDMYDEASLELTSTHTATMNIRTSDHAKIRAGVGELFKLYLVSSDNSSFDIDLMDQAGLHIFCFEKTGGKITLKDLATLTGYLEDENILEVDAQELNLIALDVRETSICNIKLAEDSRARMKLFDYAQCQISTKDESSARVKIEGSPILTIEEATPGAIKIQAALDAPYKINRLTTEVQTLNTVRLEKQK